MRRMKKWIMFSGICMFLAGCGAGALNEAAKTTKTEETNVVSEIQTEEDNENLEINVEDSLEETIWSEDMIRQEILFFEENFAGEMEFHDMDAGQVSKYGKSIESSYEFTGRVTDDGYGYVLGFKKGNKDPFEGYDHYWRDQDYVIVNRNENTGEETMLFSLSELDNIYLGNQNDILYFDPSDLEEPEEIGAAFVQKYCSGEGGVQYLNDVMERGVRFTAPDSGAYLEVYRYENGRCRSEYVPLTDLEEYEILNSDALILPEWYGKFGLQFFVSEKIYEKTDEEMGAITLPALKIAEERCRFVAMDLSEIRDITEAKLEMDVWDEKAGERKLEFRVTDDATLAELEEIFSSAEVFYEGKCPYTGILTLTREDGMELVLSLATDSCDGFIFGSCGIYTAGKENTARIWEIFSGARPYTGW